METLCWLEAADMSAQFASKALDPTRVTASVLRRIEACEPKLNAIYLRKAESATADAERARERWRAAQPMSPLDGVPVTIKENLYSIGDPAPIGTAANPISPKAVNSPVVDRVLEAGMVVVGKTTMPDYGMLTSGQSSIHGVTRNPWQLDRNPGGSSSGASAACAGGYGPLHIGTDIGGSVRLPASFCGIYGLKPSLGRVPINPPFMGRVAGPMTRTVRDAAMLMDVMSKPDPKHRDFMNLPPHEFSFARDLERFDVRGKRIGVFVDSGWGWSVQADVAAAVWDAAQKLEMQGAQIFPMESILTPQIYDAMCAFFEARSGADISMLPDEQKAKILPFIVHWATHRSMQFSGRRLMRFYNDVMAMRERTVEATHAFDFVLSPVCPIPAFEADYCCPGNDPERALHHIAFTVPYNMSEQPAASVNWWYSTEAKSEGLPIGVQVAGRRFDDLGVLQMSRVLEQLRPEQRLWPMNLG
jgi:aspartyl-tRNA(Asn)/glutamyl-tRNA(Gln) amidotransferase subunit A